MHLQIPNSIKNGWAYHMPQGRGLANRGYDILMHHHALCAHHTKALQQWEGAWHKRGPYHNGYTPDIHVHASLYPQVNHGYCCAQPTPTWFMSGANCNAANKQLFPTTSHCHNKTMMPYYIIIIHSYIINLTHSSYSLCPPFILPHYNTKSLIKIDVPIPTQIST